MRISTPQDVGRRLCLIGTLVGLAALVCAAEPARLGPIKYLRDGQIDKLCVPYQGSLRYRETQYPSLNYGCIDFESATADDPQLHQTLEGNFLRKVHLRAVRGNGDRLRLQYELDKWIAPTFHDSGKALEIRFVQLPDRPQPAAAELAIPPLPATSGAEGAAPTPQTAPDPAAAPTGNFSGDIFAEYLKMNTKGSSGVGDLAPPSPPRPMLAAASAEAAPTAAETAIVLASAQGGEGTPPAAAQPAAPAATAAKTSGKAFVPKTALADEQARITGRGFEFVDLTEEAFQRPVTLTFKDADLQNAIRILARHADINLVMDPAQVKGRLTVELKDVPVGAALSSVLRSNQLELVRESGAIYRVVAIRQVRRAIIEQNTIHIPLNWVSAAEVARILDPIVDGDISADTLGNALVVTDTPLKLEEIANIIRRMDRPEKQVMLEARLVEMDLTMERALASGWDLYRVDNDGAFLADMINGVQKSGVPAVPIIEDRQLYNQFRSLDFGGLIGRKGIDSLGFSGGQGTWTFGKGVSFFGQDFQLDVLLTALESAGLAKVLVTPRVTTVNNQQAKITVQRNIPWSSTIVGAGGSQAITYNYEPVGIDITVTPNITNNDYVRMRIIVKQDVDRGRPALAPLGRPIIDTRQSQTNVIVRDEDTAVIAGLREQDFSKNEAGVPWFRRIPVIGWAFKNKTYSILKTDLLAFITPRIIKEGQILTDNEQFRYNEIDVQWDLPDYFFDDVKFDLNDK